MVTTFDLGVCIKAFPIILNHPIKYENHIIMIGTFHIVCTCLKMIGKKMEESRLSYILIEAGMIWSGSLNVVISGKKNYSIVLHCHKTLLEALERMLFCQFMDSNNDEILLGTLSDNAFDAFKYFVDEPSRLVCFHHSTQ